MTHPSKPLNTMKKPIPALGLMLGVSMLAGCAAGTVDRVEDRYDRREDRYDRRVYTGPGNQLENRYDRRANVNEKVRGRRGLYY